MELRLAMSSDFKRFLPIKEKFFEDYGIPKKSQEFILREFKEHLEKGAVIVCLQDNTILGYLLGVIERNKYEVSGYISEIFVQKEFRGRGIATKLKDKFLKFLEEKRINLCRIDVSPVNPAQKIYEKWGFKTDKYRMSLKL